MRWSVFSATTDSQEIRKNKFQLGSLTRIAGRTAALSIKINPIHQLHRHQAWHRHGPPALGVWPSTPSSSPPPQSHALTSNIRTWEKNKRTIAHVNQLQCARKRSSPPLAISAPTTAWQVIAGHSKDKITKTTRATIVKVKYASSWSVCRIKQPAR